VKQVDLQLEVKFRAFFRTFANEKWRVVIDATVNPDKVTFLGEPPLKDHPGREIVNWRGIRLLAIVRK
jgi:hypothetical protein